MKIEASGLTEYYDITAAHAPGEIVPTFTVSIFPHEGTLGDQTRHFSWTPPSSVTFSIGAASWTCTPRENPRRISKSGGVGYSVTYIPTPLYTLQTANYGKHLVWLSSPDWQYDLYADTFDTDEYKVMHKTDNVYNSGGWTVNEILSSLGGLFGISILSDLPDLHVPQPSVILRKDQHPISLIQGLLPPGFPYVWDWRDNAFHVALAEPAITDFSIPYGAYNITYDPPENITYNSITVTGAPYKINHEMSLDPHGLSSISHARAKTIITDTEPDRVETVDGYQQTTKISRTIQTDYDGNPFAVLTETVEIYGPILNKSGAYSSTGLVQRIETTNSYELNDPVTYEAPRLVSSTVTKSGYVTKVINSTMASSNGTLYYLTDDYKAISYDDYQGLSDPGAILGSVYTSWQDNYETITETKEYVTPEDVTLDWPEGAEAYYAEKMSRYRSLAYGRYIHATENSQQVAQQIIYDMAQTEASSLGSVGISTAVTSHLQKRVRLESGQSYTYDETNSVFNPNTGKMEVVNNRTRIGSAPPSSPTRYRTEPLKATVGESGEKVVYTWAGQIPTANPSDFETWAGKLYYEVTQPRNTMTFACDEYVVPQGYRLAGGTVIGWSASQKGAVFSAQMTLQ